MKETMEKTTFDATLKKAVEQFNTSPLAARTDYIFQQAKDDLENIRKLDPEEVRQIYEGYTASGLTYEAYVQALPESGDLRAIGNLIGRFIAYCDVHASGAKQWNPDRLFLAKASIRQNHWVKHILQYVKNKGDLTGLASGVGNLIRYLERPSEEVPIADNRTRQLISEHILKKTYIPEKFVTEIKQLFQENGLQTAHPDNFTYGLNRILFGELKAFWRNAPKYWRLGTREGEKSVWLEMRDNQLASIGWNDLGDLDQKDMTKGIIKDKLASMGYHYSPSLLSRKAGEIFDFLTFAEVEDIIVAVDGQQIKGIGKIAGEYHYDPDMPTFWHTRPVDWLVVNVNFPKLEEGPQTTFFELKKPESRELIRNLINNLPMLSTSKSRSVYSLNTILYGPPGTGKTYNSIDLAIQIADGQSAVSHKANKERFEQLREEGRIEFVTFHQNYAYEDFVVGLRPDTTSSALKFESKQGVFFRIANLARENWANSLNIQKAFEPAFDEVFNSFFENLIEEEVPGVEISMRYKKYTITGIDFTNGYIKFTKSSGGTGHDLIISVVKGLYEGTHTYRQDGLGIYYYPLVERLREHARELKKEVKNEELKNYVLIIDEINRANISRVFGELITLIEDDKRLGTDNELVVTLPNGERGFGVPPNLYIIGTMNTADKSIALVDIALRRRFEFVGYYPTSNILEELQAKGLISSAGRKLLQQLNKGIYAKKKTADFLIGHAYLIGKTESTQIEATIVKKIIPLLMEYFSGNTDEVSRLFLGSGWNVEYQAEQFSWSMEQDKN